ncbi:class II glutamine amidotransferase [Vitiosangium sp. GDMCC 1.1324]|uniref:class II glutamine amidotransferase n=1 Tax=Vitiosangium sp. (strain GDMCC 1.1324) TaxID=2138576 RepID=UPI000D3B8818|nr:class II glutamine amidotransferase [Vitiosangium sp. GDMCC 1.1324]PTL77266.1 class II glutamine amidotransferase [Vitiosangium sp. GDMCC 1.1324]
MCRLFGFRSSVPTAVHPSLVTEKNSLLQQSREHKDGWGIATYEAGERPLVAHGLGPAYCDPDFERVSSRVSSRTVVAHLRLASVGAVEKRNAHPFHHGRWCFVHNGTLKNFARHKAVVEALIRPELLANIQGATDSERCFYLFLTRLSERQCLVGPACVEKVARALAETMELVSAITDEPGQDRSSMNFLVTNGDVMVATRRNRTLFLSDTAPETGKRPHRMHAGPPKPGTQLEQFVLASEQLSGEDHWHVIDEEDVVGVDNGLVLHRWKVQDLYTRP